MNAHRPMESTRRRDSETEHKQHRLVALLLQLRRECMLADRDAAEAREDRDVLLAVDLERHRRPAETNNPSLLPVLLPTRRHVCVHTPPATFEGDSQKTKRTPPHHTHL